MRMKEHLLAMQDQIKCTACGLCCPNYCPAKEGNLCRQHPSLVGENGTRGLNCDLSPVILTLSPLGVACPPVLDVVQGLASVRLATERLANGVEVIEGYSFYSSPSKFRPTTNPFSELLETEIEV